MAIMWPRKILPPQTPSFHLRGMNITGPVSASGAADVISGDSSFWVATFTSVVVTTKERVLTFRGIASKLQGRLYPIIVPWCKLYQPLVEGYDGAPIPHSDGSYFSDGTGYVNSGTDVRTISDLPEHAVSATVDIVYADDIQPGQVFSFGNRLYQLTDVDGATLKWQPPLRESVIAGTELNFTFPRCQMRLASDDEMMLDLDMGRRGFPTVNFVEDLVS